MTRLLVVMVLALLSGCRAEQRPQAMRALIREAVAPAYRQAARDAHALSEALAAFEAAPDSPRLAAARLAWQTAALTWRRLLAYRLGNVGESGVLSRTSYWPVQPAAIERLLASPRPAADLIAEAGAPAKGLFAIEHLLHAASVSPGAGQSPRLMLALARDIESAAATALRDLEGEAERLAARPNETINKLVEQLFETVDFLTATRLSYPLAATATQLRDQPVEGQASGTSLPLTLAVLEGVDRLYTVGLEHLVTGPVPAVASRLRAALDRARAAIGAIGMPIEDAARRAPAAVRDAAEATRALEKALKVELAGALGVTATFSSGDGD